jgi:hypothetical protein
VGAIRRREAILELGSLALCTVPACVIGWATVLRHTWAIWTGWLYLILHLPFLAGILAGHETILAPVDLGGVYTNPAARVPVFTLLILVALLGVAIYSLALCAHYARRE